MSIFNILLTIHILFGTICLITGIVAMVAQKKKGKHTEWGEIYHASYVVITLTAIILSILNWDKIAYLFYVAIISLFICDLRISRKKKTMEKLVATPYQRYVRLLYWCSYRTFSKHWYVYPYFKSTSTNMVLVLTYYNRYSSRSQCIKKYKKERKN